MSKGREEKRQHPRIRKELALTAPPGIRTVTADVGEGGARFNTAESIAGPQIPLTISFPDGFELKADARLVWRRAYEKGASLYGVEFVGLQEGLKIELRRELIKSQVAPLLEGIKDSNIRGCVEQFFMRDMLEYTSEITLLAAQVDKEPAYSDELENKFAHLNNQILLKGFCLGELIDDSRIMDEQKKHFRSLVGTWAYKSPIVRRAFEKPCGYPADFSLLEAIYDNWPQARGGIGLYFDRYFLNNPYVVAVRSRKDRFCEILTREIRQHTRGTLRIFAVACGPCREIRDIPPAAFKGHKVHCTCLDRDEQALSFARGATASLPAEVSFHFVKEDVMELSKEPYPTGRFLAQDLIYSVGLIDYLPDRSLKSFVRFFFGLLKPGGRLVLTHKNKEKNFSPLPPDWFCDWRFVARSKDEVMHLFYSAGIEGFAPAVSADEFNDIYYFTLTRH